MSKPRFSTICQQAKPLLDMIPDKEETIQYLIDNYREAAEIFFAEGMYWELYGFDKKYPDVTSSFNALKKVVEVYDTLPQDVYKIMEVDSFRPATIFHCGRKAERAILNHQDVVEAMKGYQGDLICFQVLLNQKRQTFLHLLAMSCHSEINDSDSWWSEGKLLTWQHE